jgi:predicted type IV restriction endonuclease
VSTVDDAFRRIAELPASGLVSEEDVKIKVVLPILRAVGYNDSEFNYERRTGRGYVDVMVDHFPTGIVVEAKAPKTRLDRHIEQLENYVFHKHGRDRATIAILTDGETFNIYGVTEALVKGELESFRILSFQRSTLTTPEVATEVRELLAKENNEKRTIPEAISRQRKKQDRLGPIETELRDLNTERERIDARMQELHAEQALILGSGPRTREAAILRDSGTSDKEGDWSHAATPHILRLLKERGAISRATAIDRKWLDRQLIKKVEKVNNDEAVSHGLIELREKGVANYEKQPIGKAWLK